MAGRETSPEPCLSGEKDVSAARFYRDNCSAHQAARKKAVKAADPSIVKKLSHKPHRACSAAAGARVSVS